MYLFARLLPIRMRCGPARTLAVRALARLLIALLLAGAALPPASAWTRNFSYRADGKRLADVLQDFAASQSMPVVIDAGVEGQVNGEFNAAPKAFLAAIATSYNLIWYFDGVTLFVYPSRMMQSRVFRLRGNTREQVSDMLSSLGLGDARYPLRFNDAEQTLLAYGPPRHIELVQTVIETLDSGLRDRIGKSIQVFALRYATAADRVTGATRTAGLVSILNTLFGHDPRRAADASGYDAARRGASSIVGEASKRRSAELTYGLKSGESAGAGSGGASRDGNRDASGRQLQPELSDSHAEAPLFQADEASNSIIVRGLPERMPQYEALIRQLDIPQELVEVEAQIIDVRRDALDSLGVDWQFSKTGGSSLAVLSGEPVGNVAGANMPTSIANPNITTLLGNGARQLLARIRFLEGNGKARIVARPKVLGAANRMASMVDKRVASVRVAGNLEVNLFTIEAGTTLQIVPQIVPHPGEPAEVRMTLFIEDGSFDSTQSVDQVPVVKRTEIRTEAAVREGQSLLIGGISVESDISGRTGLPGLSRVPFFGGLFRHDEATSQRSERMFLITPKLVSLQLPVGPVPPGSPSASAMPVPLPAPAAPVPLPEAAAPAEPPAPAANEAPASKD